MLSQLEGVMLAEGMEYFRRCEWILLAQSLTNLFSFPFLQVTSFLLFPILNLFGRVLCLRLPVLGKLKVCDLLQHCMLFVLLSPSLCVLCRKHSENLDHMFLHCPFSLTLWHWVLRQLGIVPSVCWFDG